MNKKKIINICTAILLIIFYFLPIIKWYISSSPDTPQKYAYLNMPQILLFYVKTLFESNGFLSFLINLLIVFALLIPLIIPIVSIFLNIINKHTLLGVILMIIMSIIMSITCYFGWIYLISFATLIINIIFEYKEKRKSNN